MKEYQHGRVYDQPAAKGVLVCANGKLMCYEVCVVMPRLEEETVTRVVNVT
jgi:hypothetical protein